MAEDGVQPVLRNLQINERWPSIMKEKLQADDLLLEPWG